MPTLRQPARNRYGVGEISSSATSTFLRPESLRALVSSSRSSSKGSMRTCESEPTESRIPRARISSAGRNPSPRFPSVVGQAHTDAPCSESRSSSFSLACVAWIIVVRVRRNPALASSSMGRIPCSVWHSSISRSCSSAWMCSGRPLRWAYLPPPPATLAEQP